MENHQFVFIGGLHRSGTSILFRCMREHPQISGFKDTGVSEDEGQHLQSVYQPAIVYGGPGKFGFNSESHLTENSPLINEDNRRKLFSEWEEYWNLEKPVLLEKSPPNLIRTRFLQQMFPNSYFVVLMRNPIAVAYATQKWSNTSISSLIEHWLVCHERFESDKTRLNRVITLKYEDFVSNPQAGLSQLYAFLGLNDYPNSLEIRTDVNAKYLMKWSEQQKSPSDYEEVVSIKEKFEERVAHLDYSLN